jgi:hypothetical protein
VWAVGDSAPPGAPDQTLVEHWSGTSWSIVASPDPGAVGDILQGVAAISPADAWAVGARQDTATFYQHPMALHWDGAWGLAFDPGGQLWAAGTHESSQGFNVPLILTQAPGTAARG